MRGIGRSTGWRVGLCVVVFSAACAESGRPWAEEAQAAAGRAAEAKPFFDHSILLGAHRGGAHLVPESTAVGFQEAAARWPSILLETDAALTADGHVVLLHDETVDRTTNGSGAVGQMTLAEVQALDAGYRLTPDGGTTYPYRGRGITIPTLEEVLTALSDERFLIELKPFPGIADAAVDVLRRTGAEERALLASFAPELMDRVRDPAPQIAVCYDVRNGIRLATSLRLWWWDTYRPEAGVLSLMRGMARNYGLSAEDIRAIRRKGVLVQIHTVNDPEEMRYWLDLGVDSLLTDRPDLVADVIAQRIDARDRAA